MPDHEMLEQLLELFMEYGYQKITYCSECYYWGTYQQRQDNIPDNRHCRKWGQETDHQCYCAEALAGRWNRK